MTSEARKLLQKGKRALRAAETLLAANDAEFAAGRAYYAMLHAAQALLREHDVTYRKHSAVHAAFGERFAKQGVVDAKYHRWLLDSSDERLRSDYDAQPLTDRDAVEATVERAREFLDAAETYLNQRAARHKE